MLKALDQKEMYSYLFLKKAILKMIDLSEQGKKGPKAALYNKGESLFPLTELEASKYRENIIFSTGFREI